MGPLNSGRTGTDNLSITQRLSSFRGKTVQLYTVKYTFTLYVGRSAGLYTEHGGGGGGGRGGGGGALGFPPQN